MKKTNLRISKEEILKHFKFDEDKEKVRTGEYGQVGGNPMQFSVDKDGAVCLNGMILRNVTGYEIKNSAVGATELRISLLVSIGQIASE